MNESCSAPVSRSPRHLQQGYSLRITLRCNSRQFLIAKGLRRDVLLSVFSKAQAKVPRRFYAVCLMTNRLHLLIRPDDASKLPKLMHWFGWTFSHGTQSPNWTLRSLLGSQVLRHCDCAKRPQTGAEYTQDYPCQPQSSWSAKGVL